MYPQMRLQTKLIRDGNSWGIRLPKAALALAGLKPGAKLDLEVRQGRLILRLTKRSAATKLDQAYQDVKAVWEEALEDAWLEIFGPEYD